MPRQILQGKRILIAEDEPLTAMLLDIALDEAGCTPVGPFASLAEATAAVNSQTLDGAVLDIRLGGALAFPVVRLLNALNIPVVVVSGYTPAILPADLAGTHFCEKPFDTADLVRLLESIYRAKDAHTRHVADLVCFSTRRRGRSARLPGQNRPDNVDTADIVIPAVFGTGRKRPN